MAGNTVTLTFAGDSKSLERTFDRVGSGAKEMAGELDSAGGRAKKFGGAMEGVNDTVDKSEGKFIGSADLLDGLGGAFGLPTDGAVGLLRSFGDLASGFATVLGPAIGGVLAKIGLLTAAETTEAAAAGTATTAQYALNTALLANPVGLVIAAIVALGAAFVVAWKYSETFRDVVKAAFGVVKDAAVAVKDTFVNIVSVIGSIFAGVGKAISEPFVAAFGLIKKIWNSTLGGFGFEFGGWDPPGPGPKIPGIKFKIPEMHTGGVVPGPAGAEVPIMALAGETVIPRGQTPAAGPMNVNVYLDGRAIHQSLLRLQRTSGPLGLT